MDNFDSASVIHRDRRMEVRELTTDPPCYMIMPTFAGIRPLIKDIVLPQSSKTIFCSKFIPGGDFVGAKGATHKHLQGFTVESFGLVIDPVQLGKLNVKTEILERRDYVFARTYWYQSSAELIQVWRTRVFRTTPELFAPSTANPVTPCEPNFPYLQESRDPRSKVSHTIVGGVDRFLVGFALLEQFIASTRTILLRSHTIAGRPRAFESRQQFLRQVEQAYLAVWQERKHIPAQKEVAEKLTCNPLTFKDYWSNDGIMPWRDLFEFWIRK